MDGLAENCIKVLRFKISVLVLGEMHWNRYLRHLMPKARYLHNFGNSSVSISEFVLVEKYLWKVFKSVKSSNMRFTLSSEEQ